MSSVTSISRIEAENLGAEIQALQTLRVKDDPKLVASAKRLAELKGKPGEIEEEIKKLEADVVTKEKSIAQEVLAGGAAAVSGLSKLREKIADLREEHRIFGDVIAQATKAHEELRAELEADRRQRCQRALKAALKEVVSLFEAGEGKLTLVKDAAHLAQAFWVTTEIQDIERLVKGIAGRVSEAKS